MASRPVRIPASNSARRLFVWDLVKRAGRIDMESVYVDHGVPSNIVRAAVKDLAESGLVKVERDRWVSR